MSEEKPYLLPSKAELERIARDHPDGKLIKALADSFTDEEITEENARLEREFTKHAPKPGTTVSERRSELLSLPFRYTCMTAFGKYRLMSYEEALGDHEVVLQAVLDYELAAGLIKKDEVG